MKPKTMKPKKNLAIKRHAAQGLTRQERHDRFAAVAEGVAKRTHGRSAEHRPAISEAGLRARVASLRVKAARVRGPG